MTAAAHDQRPTDQWGPRSVLTLLPANHGTRRRYRCRWCSRGGLEVGGCGDTCWCCGTPMRTEDRLP